MNSKTRANGCSGVEYTPINGTTLLLSERRVHANASWENLYRLIVSEHNAHNGWGRPTL